MRPGRPRHRLCDVFSDAHEPREGILISRKMGKMATPYTETDLEQMSRHDCHIWSFELRAGEPDDEVMIVYGGHSEPHVTGNPGEIDGRQRHRH